jgi:hypothetical protein
MQVVDANGNVFGAGLEVTGSDGKPKVPVINTDITIGTTAIVGGVVGQVLFQGTGNVVQESPNFLWDNINGRITVNAITNGAVAIFKNSTNGLTIYPQSTQVQVYSDYFGAGTDKPLIFGTYTNRTNQFSLFTSGNIGVNTAIDAGFKFDVIGSTRVTSLKTADIFPASASISLWVNTLNAASRFYTAPVHQDGRINFNSIAGSSDQVLIRAWHNGQFGLGTGSSSAGGALTIRGDSLLIGTSGSLYIMAGTFGPVNVPYRLGITTNATTTGFHTGVGNNLTNIESAKFEYTAVSHTFYTGTTTGNQGNPNQYTPLFLSNLGNVGIGTITLGTATKLTIGGTQTASSAIARGDLINITLAAAANNDVLVGLDIAPTYTNGAFTGLTNVDLRVKGAGVVIGSGAGYGAAYGYNNDGLFQFSTSGTSSVITLRPNNTATNYNSSYWSNIIQENYSFKIVPGNYQSLYLRNYSVSGAVYVGGRENANSYGIYIPSNTANVLINTTTDAGFRLDVNGTARVTGNFGVNQGSSISVNGPGGGNAIYSQGNSTFIIYNRGAAIANFYNGGSDATQGVLIGNGVSLAQPPNTTSTLLELISTTKGFLPPRMTNAQMLAIATPATSLMVYDTTNNKLCCYDGTTWQNLF